MSNGSQSIDRAAELLSLVVRAETAVSYTDLVDQTGLARSTVSRLLQALERNGLIERNRDGLFLSGALFTHYAARFDQVETLTAAAQPVLERVADETGETVNLGVPRGDTVVQVAQIDSSFILGATDWIDVDVPVHCSALGKVLYAFEAIPFPKGRLESRTTTTLTSGGAIRKEVTSIRKNGFAVTRGELEEGLDALAAPVRGSDGLVQAAIGISGPSFRLEKSHRQIGGFLVTESDRLSRALAHRARKERSHPA